MHFISTRTFEKVADENVSAFRETTPSHGTWHYGTEEEQNDAKERRKEREVKRGGKRTMQPQLLFL